VTLRALLVDDEDLARARLRTQLGHCSKPGVSVQGEASHATQAMKLLREQAFDLVLLDIHMPGTDGMTLAKMLQDLPCTPAVIFVTAHAEHAVQAFELEAVDYLTKPVRLERLQQSLQKVEQYIQSNKGDYPDITASSLMIAERGRTERLPLSEVLYFKAELKYITVRTLRRSYLLESTISELDEKYANLFLRIHRNALVARRAIRALEKHPASDEGDGWVVRLQGLDETLAVSRRQLGAVRDALAFI
jgi:two-component system, LytTR family, response regulator AlgR